MIPRRAARVLLVDGSRRVLLFQRFDPRCAGRAVLTEFAFDGRQYPQEQDFLLVRVPSWSVQTSGFDGYERRAVIGYRWWTIEELETTGELYYPRELPGLLRELLDGDRC